jgi:hypothetical protein
MKEKRVQILVNELNETVERLNRITELLNKTNTNYQLVQHTRNGPWVIYDIEQRVKYD